MRKKGERGLAGRGERGMTLVELIVAVTIMALLTTMSVPLVRYRVQRDRERDLRRALDTIDKAIDDYKDAALAGKIEVKLGTDGYPESLDELVKGVKLLQDAQGKKIKFLRRVPIDPMTNSGIGHSAVCRTILSLRVGDGRIFSMFIARVRIARGMGLLMRSGRFFGSHM